MDKKYLISYDYIYSPFSLPDFNVYQIGRIVCNEKTFYANHYHSDWYELTIVREGEGVVYTNNKPVTVKAGDIFLSCLHDIHAIKSSKVALQYDFCSFYPKDKTLADRFSDLSNALISEKQRVFHSNQILSLLPLAINEIQNTDREYFSELLNGIFWQIAVYTLRSLKKDGKTENNAVTDKNILCYQLMDYINSNIDGIRSLTELADEFGYSYNYLSALFKEVTSMTLIEFYNMQRLSIAEKLIMEKNLTLEEIAEKTNFSTAFSLSKAFKKRYKLSPKEYRKLKTTNV